MNKRQLANKYREAAKVIENQPRLHRGTFKASDGCYCAVGALMHVQGIEPDVLTYPPTNGLVSDRTSECNATRKLLGLGPLDESATNAMGFNDRFAKSKREVARHLRTTARAIEHGGKL